jgi:hypothetical protein
VAQHEAAQVNYNINELIVNRCSAGLFTPSGHLSGSRRSRARDPADCARRASAGPRRGGPRQSPTGPACKGERAPSR